MDSPRTCFKKILGSFLVTFRTNGGLHLFSTTAMFRTIQLFLSLLIAASLQSQPPGLYKKVDQYFASFVKGKDFAGNILIAKDGKIIFQKSYGLADMEHGTPVSTNTVFHVASVSKPFTAILIMKLQEEGKLSVKDSLRKYLPGFPHGGQVTIHHLLSQTSGYADYNKFSDYYEFSIRNHTLAETVAWFRDKPLSFPPGSTYGYSNANYVLLAYLIEVITGESYETYLKKIITTPLGMLSTGNFSHEEIVPNRASGYDIAPGIPGLRNAPYYDKSFKRGSGALHTTAGDLLKLDRALYTDQLLTSASREQMFSQIDSNGYGYGWGIGRRFGKYAYVEHDGKSPGFAALFSRYPKEKVTIIFLSNINSGLFGAIRKDLAAIVFGEAYQQPVERSYMELPEGERRKFTGLYRFANGFEFRIKDESGTLNCYFGTSRDAVLLSPVAADKLFIRARFDLLTLKQVDGKPVIEYAERGGTSICAKID